MHVLEWVLATTASRKEGVWGDSYDTMSFWLGDVMGWLMVSEIAPRPPSRPLALVLPSSVIAMPHFGRWPAPPPEYMPNPENGVRVERVADVRDASAEPF